MATAPGSGQPPETRSAASGFPGFRALPAFLERAGFWRPSWAELAAGRAEPAGGLEAPTGRRLGAGLGGGTAAWVGRTRGPTGACARATCSAGNREGAWGGGGAGRYRAAAQEAGTGDLATAASPALEPQPARCILARVRGKPVQGTPPTAAPRSRLLWAQPRKATLEDGGLMWSSSTLPRPPLVGIWRRPTSSPEADVNVGWVLFFVFLGMVVLSGDVVSL